MDDNSLPQWKNHTVQTENESFLSSLMTSYDMDICLAESWYMDVGKN